MKIKNFAIIVLSIFISVASFGKSKKHDYLITIKTDYGEIKAILFDDTPIHKNNFIELAKAGKYDGSNFHRVIKGFMIQGGVIEKEDGFDTLSFKDKTLKAEIKSNHKHIRGAIAAARTGNPEKRSDKSQFYIVQGFNGAHHLDNNYTVFGQVITGMDVVDEIAAAKVKKTKPVKEISFEVTVEKVKRKNLIKFYGDIYKKYNIKNNEKVK